MRTIWLTLLMWPLIALPISAQAAPGGSANIPAASASPATPLAHITLGQATFALNGPWKFRTGDDLGWAAADFDDSAWGTMDLTPPPGSYDPITGNSGFVPGWTTRGFPGYAGYAWYRLRVNIQDNVQRGENGELALKMPENVDDIYQVFVNGRMIGEFGRFEPQGNTLYMTQPRAFSLPADLGNGPMTIAVRMWMSAATPLYDPDTGGMHGAPVLGRASVVQALLRLDWDVLDRANESDFLEIWILLTAMLVALALFWMDRDEKAYLLLALTCISLAVYPFLIVCGILHHLDQLDSRSVASRFDSRAAGDGIMGTLLGVLVPLGSDRPYRARAPDSLDAGCFAAAGHLHVASASVWQRGPDPCHRLAFADHAGVEAAAGSFASVGDL